MLNKKKNNKGFTLVELLVVIAIIGILAVVAVPALFKNIEKGKVAELESDISAIRSAALSYYAENSKYPVTDSFSDSTLAVTVPVTKPQLTTQEEARNAILKEVESLGFPFKGSYTLSGTEPGKALLTINLSTGVQLSEDAAKKLVNDLGKVLIVVNTQNKIYTESGNATDQTNGVVDLDNQADGDLDDITGDVSKVIIELMDGANQ